MKQSLQLLDRYGLWFLSHTKHKMKEHVDVSHVAINILLLQVNNLYVPKFEDMTILHLISVAIIRLIIVQTIYIYKVNFCTWYLMCTNNISQFSYIPYTKFILIDYTHSLYSKF